MLHELNVRSCGDFLFQKAGFNSSCETPEALADSAGLSFL